MDGERGRPSELEDLPTRRPLPWFIISLIILSWIIFIYALYKNNCPSRTPQDECLLIGALGRLSFQPFRQNSQFGPAMSTLMDLGGLNLYSKMKQTTKWHILSSIFLYKGLASLTLNTFSLVYTSMEFEQKFGIVKIGLLYFLSSLGGSLWACLIFSGAVYVGGPSGVCGLTGGAFAELFINFNMHEEKLKRFMSLCLGVAINFTIKVFPGTDVSANIGGLYTGFLLGFLLLIRRQPESTGYEYKRPGFHPQLIMNYRPYQQVLWVIALTFTIIQFLYSLIMFCRERS